MDLIIFDCDGVLVDSEMLASQVLSDFVTELGFDLSPATCRARFTGKSIASVVEDLASDITLPDDFTDQLRARDKVVFDRDLKAIDGIADMLAHINHKVCVASSGSMEKIRHSLTKTGLLDFFSPHLFSAQMVTHGKPAPDLFLYAATQMQVPAANCLVIEDSVAGVRAARAAGMNVFGFTGGSHCDEHSLTTLKGAGADIVFSRMSDLANLMFPHA